MTFQKKKIKQKKEIQLIMLQKPTNSLLSFKKNKKLAKNNFV